MSSNFLFFFFSSRRRHTSSDRDWSSDVCSSDLEFSGFFLGFFIGRETTPSAPPKNPRKPLTVTSYCCQLAFFLLHSNMNLSRFREENRYGPLHPHRTHQRRRRQISVRQRAVLEESAPAQVSSAGLQLWRSYFDL